MIVATIQIIAITSAITALIFAFSAALSARSAAVAARSAADAATQAAFLADRAISICPGETEITPEMVEAGESVLWQELGGFPTLAADFSAPEMAEKVFLAMESHRPKERGEALHP